MGAKFIIDRRCSVKSSLSLTGLVEAIKQQGVLRQYNDLVAAGKLPPQEGDVRLDMVWPQGPGDVTLNALRAQRDALVAHRMTCRQCRSSLRGQVGGCIAYVPYPLTAPVEHLLWRTAVRSLQGELPEPLLEPARAFAEKAMKLKATPFYDDMRKRGDLQTRRPEVFVQGMPWRQQRLSSGQVLNLFFSNGALSGEDLKVHSGFLAAALALGRAVEQALDERAKKPNQEGSGVWEAMAPYATVHELMESALEQGLGLYSWP
ncbi:MAG: hypothetical protein ACM3XM_18850 [Mycobacterium leprae]